MPMGASELPAPRLTAGQGMELATLAVSVVGARLLGRPFEPAEPGDSALRGLGASFVTIERDGVLRGCIGMLEAVRPLYQDVARNAARAMNDPRLPAVTAEEWIDLSLKVSVLSESRPLVGVGIDGLPGVLRPGIDGVILADGLRRATFLPAVWTKIPDPYRFVEALLAKGGWTRGDAVGLTAARYVAEEFLAQAPQVPLANLA